MAADALRDPRYGWAIVAALSVSVTVSYGVLAYAFGVLLVPMERDLGWSRTEITGAYSLALLVAAATGLVVGSMLDRRSPRAIMTAGGALGAVLVVAWSQVESLVQLYAVFAALGVAMATLLYPPVFTVVTKWFPVRRAAAITFVTVVGATAALIFAPLTEQLESALGWRDAVLVLAVVLAVTTVPLHGLVLRPAPRDEVVVSEPAPRAVIRSRAFLLLIASFALVDFTWGAVVVHLIALLVVAGNDAALGALIVGIAGIAQLPGRLVFAPFVGRASVSAQPIFVYLPACGGLALLAVSREPVVAIIFAILYGASNGMGTVFGAIVIADLWGRGGYGAIASVKSAAMAVARAAAPVGASLVLLLPGGYTTLLWLLAIITGAAALIARSGVKAADEATS